MTISNWVVDQKFSQPLGWYLYSGMNSDPNYGSSGAVSDDAKSIAATLKDYPGVPPIKGLGRNSTWEFQTFAIAKTGNGGTVLSGLSWGFTVDADMHLTSSEPAVITNYKDFNEAIAEWNKQALGKTAMRNTDENNKEQQVPFENLTLHDSIDK